MSETMPRIESQPVDDVEVRRAEAIADAFKAATAFLDSMNKTDGASPEEKEWARTQAMGILASLGNTLPAPEIAEATSETVDVAPVSEKSEQIMPEPIVPDVTQESEKQLGGFKKGDKVRLSLDGKDSKSYDATVIKLSPDIDKIVVEYKRHGAPYRRWLTPAELTAMQPQESAESVVDTELANGTEMGQEERAQTVLDALEASKPLEVEGDIAPEPVAEQESKFEPAYRQNDVVKLRFPKGKEHEGLVVSSSFDENGHEWVKVIYDDSDNKDAKEPFPTETVPAAALAQMQEPRKPITSLDAVDAAIASAEEELKKDKKHRWSNFKNWLNGKSGLVYEGTKERIRRHPRAAIALGITAVGLLLLSRDSFNGSHSDLPLADVADKLTASTGHTEIEHVTNATHAANEVISIPDGSGGEALMKSLKLNPNTWYAHENDFAKAFPDLTYRMPDGHIGLVDVSATGATSRYSGDVRDWWQSQR